MRLSTCLALGLAACAARSDDPGDLLDVTVESATAIPPDGTCIHIIATSMSNFQVAGEYLGDTSTATLKLKAGDYRFNATAYAPPCSPPSASPPYTADPAVAQVTSASPTVKLNLHNTVQASFDINFLSDLPEAVLRAGSSLRTGNNGEEASGPGYSLDFFEVYAIPPPGQPGGRTLLFSTQGKGGLPYSPRGMAATPGGKFWFEVSDPTQLWEFDGAGTFLANVPVSYQPGQIHWDIVEALDAIDETHFVRSAWLNSPIGCDVNGNNCVQGGIEVLELQGAVAVVTSQFALPDLPAAALSGEYPVSVASLGGGAYAVVTLLNDGSGDGRLIRVNADHSITVGPTTPGDGEGTWYDGANARIVVMNYEGFVTAYNNDAGLTQRPESSSFPIGAGFSLPRSLTWYDPAGKFIALGGSKTRLVLATPDFTSVTDISYDRTRNPLPQAVEYLPDVAKLAIMDNPPPRVNGVRTPTVNLYTLAGNVATFDSAVTLTGAPTGQVRTRTLAYASAHGWLVTHYRRPGSPPDPIDTIAFVHDRGGNLVASFDLAALGFTRIESVNYLVTTDELLFVADDATGRSRLLVTDTGGNPHRALDMDGIAFFGDAAQIPAGNANAGDLGAVRAEPSSFYRFAQP